MIVAELGVAAVTFLATNTDNVAAVSALFMDECFEGRNVAVGFLLGTAIVTALSIAAAALAGTIPRHLRYGWLLGFVPLAIAMGRLCKLHASVVAGGRSVTDGAGMEHTQSWQVLLAAGITLSCSVDNFAVYTAFFAQQPRYVAVDAAVFLLLGGALCAIGHRMAEFRLLRRYGTAMSSLLLICVAMWIFAGM